MESGVGHAKKTPLKGLRFESLEQAQTYLDHWEARWADTRIHGTTKRQVAVMFAEERPFLLPLPVEPFRYYQYGKRTVHLDGCVEVDAAYYSAPPGWIGRRVPVQWDSRQVRLMNPDNGQLLREHFRQARGRHRIKDEDRPKKTPPGTLDLLCRAGKAGLQIGALCRGMHHQHHLPLHVTDGDASDLAGHELFATFTGEKRAEVMARFGAFRHISPPSPLVWRQTCYNVWHETENSYTSRSSACVKITLCRRN